MPAQKKPAQIKASRKPSEPTTVADIVKAKKLPAKGSKKITKTVNKKVAQKKPAKHIFTQHRFEQHFYSLGLDEFKALCEVYNDKQLKIKIVKQPDYDHWLNYFKSFPASHIRLLVKMGQDILDAEAYSALRMWHDIISNPQRIAKIHQSALIGPKGKEGTGIMAMALKNDRLGVLQATRDRLAEKLEKGAGARDTAALARELTEVMTAIADYEKRSGPKKTTVLGKLLEGMPGAETKGAEARKRPGKNGGGSRNTSFASRVTIKDIEESNG
jgi:hypothetical protein